MTNYEINFFSIHLINLIIGCSTKMEIAADIEFTVLESTMPGDNSVGTKVYVEILETSTVDNLIKIRTKYTESSTFVLRKIKN